VSYITHLSSGRRQQAFLRRLQCCLSQQEALLPHLMPPASRFQHPFELTSGRPARDVPLCNVTINVKSFCDIFCRQTKLRELLSEVPQPNFVDRAQVARANARKVSDNRMCRSKRNVCGARDCVSELSCSGETHSAHFSKPLLVDRNGL
jgi:hypothetical protein